MIFQGKEPKRSKLVRDIFNSLHEDLEGPVDVIATIYSLLTLAGVSYGMPEIALDNCHGIMKRHIKEMKENEPSL